MVQVLLCYCDTFLCHIINTDLTTYGQKKSIINIQDLGLSATSQHSVGGQLILRVIFRKLSIFRKKFLF
jgi:hypothetical protein